MNAPQVHTAFATSKLLANKEHPCASAATKKLHNAIARSSLFGPQLTTLTLLNLTSFGVYSNSVKQPHIYCQCVYQARQLTVVSISCNVSLLRAITALLCKSLSPLHKDVSMRITLKGENPVTLTITDHGKSQTALRTNQHQHYQHKVLVTKLSQLSRLAANQQFEPANNGVKSVCRHIQQQNRAESQRKLTMWKVALTLQFVFTTRYKAGLLLAACYVDNGKHGSDVQATGCCCHGDT